MYIYIHIKQTLEKEKGWRYIDGTLICPEKATCSLGYQLAGS